jgi:hypothetical protein
MGHDVGMATVVMAGVESSSDFSSSIGGTADTSDDRSFRIFLRGINKHNPNQCLGLSVNNVSSDFIHRPIRSKMAPNLHFFFKNPNLATLSQHDSHVARLGFFSCHPEAETVALWRSGTCRKDVWTESPSSSESLSHCPPTPGSPGNPLQLLKSDRVKTQELQFIGRPNINTSLTNG